MLQKIHHPVLTNPFLWAACVPAIVLVAAHCLYAAGLVALPPDVGLQAFSYIGWIWYFTALPLLWLINRSEFRKPYVVAAAVMPPFVVHVLFFMFGQLIPAEEEFERNTRILQFCLTISLAMGAASAAIYLFMAHLKGKILK